MKKFFFFVPVRDSAIAASCDEPLAAGRVGRTPRGGSTYLVPAATVTTGAKPHGQQQLARDLEVERAVTGQRCRPQSFGEVQRCYALDFVPHTQYSCSWASLTDQLVRKLRNGLGINTTIKKILLFVPVQTIRPYPYSSTIIM